MAHSLPMGWSWSLCFALKANLRRVSSVGLLTKSVLLTNQLQSAVLKPRSKGVTSHLIYVDNFGIQSLEEQAAKEGLDAVTTAFEEKHLKVHETEVQCEKASALGIVLDGRMLETRAREVRLRRVRSAIGTALQRKRMSGRELEVLLSHCTYLALVKRPLLGCFHASYRYVQSTYRTKTVLWNSVVQELTHFRALTIFCYSQWWPPWSTVVFSTDASLLGTGWRLQTGLAKRSRRPGGEMRGQGIGSERKVLENTHWRRSASLWIMTSEKFEKPDLKTKPRFL